MKPVWIGLLVAALAAGVYANSLANGFALDDDAIIVKNERAHGIEKVGEALGSPYWPGAPPEIALYRPLPVAMFAVEWDLWDRDPRGYHAVNVALHAAVTGLVLALLLALAAPAPAAALGAMVFAVHPVHTEAVANVVGRAELLAAFFFLLATLAYVRRDWHPAVRLPVLAFGYLLALGSKESAVMLPAVLLLLEAWRAQSATRGEAGRLGGLQSFARGVRGEAAAYAVLGGAAVAYLVFRYAALGTPIGNDTAPFLHGLALEARLATATRVWPEYVRLLLFPRDLVADYSPGVIFPLETFDLRSAIGIGIALVALTAGVAAWRRNRLLALAVFWFPITILPVSNLLVTVGVVLAERTLYLPSVCVALGTAALAAEVLRRPARGRRLVLATLVLAIALGGWWTWRRNPVWRSTETLMADLAQRHPESFRVAWLLGHFALERGDLERAIRHYDTVVELVPDHYGLLLEYGQTLVRHGRAVEAEPLLRRAMEVNPQPLEPYVYLSQALLNQARYTEAIDVVAAGLTRAELRALGGLYDQLAFAHAGLGHWPAARAARRLSLQLPGVPALWDRWHHLAQVELRLGDEAAAAAALARARELAPRAARERLALEGLRQEAAL